MKKAVAVLTAVTLTLGMMSFPISDSNSKLVPETKAENVISSNDFDYITLKNGTLKITGFKGEGSEITIPSKINGKKVTAIGNKSFYKNTEITQVIIPYGIERIGDNAFNGCTGLSEVYISETVTTIGQSAFRDCTSLERISLPESTVEIGNNAFRNCSKLSEINIPESVKKIGYLAFRNTQWLENQKEKNPLVIFNNIIIDGSDCEGKITIPDGIKEIPEYAFFSDTESNTKLTAVTVPDSVSRIGMFAFLNCTELVEITIPDTLTDIGDSAFSGTKWQKIESARKQFAVKNGVLFSGISATGSVQIPEDIHKISSFAFLNTLSLTETNDSVTAVTLPENLTELDDYALYGCTSVNEITIPASVKSIGKRSIGYCYNPDTEEPEKISGFKIRCYDRSEGFRYAVSNGFDYEIVNTHEHKFETTKYVAPTCTKKGSITLECNCGIATTAEIPASGHKYTVTVVKPTCDKNGYTEHKCSVCGDSYKTDTVKATGHKYKLYSTKNPTVSKTGQKTYKCTICGQTYSETIPKLISITSQCTAGKIPVQTYTGKQIKPTVKIYADSGNNGAIRLKLNTDYTVSYGSNKIGKGTVTIYGKGKYSGTIRLTFDIIPRKTVVSVKSYSKGKLTVGIGKRSEASKYQISYSTNSSFKGAKTVSTKSLNNLLKVSSGKTYYVRARTVRTVGKASFLSGWSPVKKIKVR